MGVYSSSIKRWDAPHENVPVTDFDRDRIVKDIRDAFRFQGFEIDVI